jgi:hypothetical protein
MSVLTALSMSIICEPRSSPDMIDGEMRSPPKVVMVLGAAARCSRSMVINGANPPQPRAGVIS